MPADHDELTRVEAACAGLAAAGQPVTFREVAALCDPTRPSTNAHHARLTSPSNTAISVWPLADPLLDWEVLT